MTPYDRSPNRQCSCERPPRGCAPILGVLVRTLSQLSTVGAVRWRSRTRRNNFKTLWCRRSPCNDRATDTTQASFAIARVEGCFVPVPGWAPLRIAKAQMLRLRNSGLAVIENRDLEIGICVGLGMIFRYKQSSVWVR